MVFIHDETFKVAAVKGVFNAPVKIYLHIGGIILQDRVKLTLKTAKALIKQEFGLSGNSLKKDTVYTDVQIYKMQLGRFEIKVENDWSEDNGLYRLIISSCTGGSIWIYYDPITLEENFEAGDKLKKSILMEQCESCPLKQNSQ